MDNDQNFNINISNNNIMTLLFTRRQDMEASAIHMDHMESFAIFIISYL